MYLLYILKCLATKASGPMYTMTYDPMYTMAHHPMYIVYIRDGQTLSRRFPQKSKKQSQFTAMKKKLFTF